MPRDPLHHEQYLRSVAQKFVPRVLVTTALALCVFVLWQSLNDFQNSPVGDLRNRITGARCLADGLDPYRASTAQLPEYYRAWTPTSISPAHLLLYLPLRNLPYGTQRKIYYIFDWLILLASLTALNQLLQAHVPRPVFLYLFAALVVLDAAFRLNLARGQSYLQLFLLVSMSALEIGNYKPTWLSPVAFGLLLLLRPTYILALAALVLMKHRAVAVRTLIATAVLAVFVVSHTGITTWKNYSRMIHRETEAHLERTVLREMQAQKVDAELYAAGPAVIEGIGSRRFLRLHGFEHDRTFLALLATGPLHNHDAKLSWISEADLRALIVSLALLCASSGFYIASRLASARDTVVQIAFAFLLPVNFEIFGPQKPAYTDLLLAFPLVLLASWAAGEMIEKRGLRDRRLLVFLATVFCFAALSRLQLGFSAGTLSIVRFFVALLTANLFCVYRAFLKRPALAHSGAEALHVRLSR